MKHSMKTKNIATVSAILAAALYALNIPLAKMLLTKVETTMMAAFVFNEGSLFVLGACI